MYNQLLNSVISLYICTPKSYICTRYLARCVVILLMIIQSTQLKYTECEVARNIGMGDQKMSVLMSWMCRDVDYTEIIATNDNS